MNVLAQFRALPLRARVMLATNAVNSFGGGLVLPFLWAYLTGVRGMGPAVPAATLALQAASAVAGGLAWGVLVDRLRYRTVVPLVMTIAGAGTALYAFAATPAVALLAAFVYGIGISGVGTVLRTMYASFTTGEDRDVVYSLDFGIFNGMTGLGVIAGGIVASAAVGDAAARYAALYVCDGVTFVLTGLVAALLLPADRDADESAARTSAPGSYLAVVRDPRVLVVLLVMLLTSFVSYGQFKSGLPGYLLATGAIGAGGLSFAFALNIAVVVLVQFLVMPHLRAVSKKFQLAASGVVFAASWLCVMLAGKLHAAALPWTALAVVLLSVGSVLVVPVLSALLNDFAADALRGRANALFSISISGGAVLGPAVTGALLARDGGSAFIAVLVACSLVSTILVLLVPLRNTPDSRANGDAVRILDDTAHQVTA